MSGIALSSVPIGTCHGESCKKTLVTGNPFELSLLAIVTQFAHNLHLFTGIGGCSDSITNRLQVGRLSLRPTIDKLRPTEPQSSGFVKFDR